MFTTFNVHRLFYLINFHRWECGGQQQQGREAKMRVRRAAIWAEVCGGRQRRGREAESSESKASCILGWGLWWPMATRERGREPRERGKLHFGLRMWWPTVTRERGKDERCNESERERQRAQRVIERVRRGFLVWESDPIPKSKRRRIGKKTGKRVQNGAI